MICPFCAREYDESQARSACDSCAMFGGCKKLKCPHCGYESPAEPRLVQWVRKKFGKKTQ